MMDTNKRFTNLICIFSKVLKKFIPFMELSPERDFVDGEEVIIGYRLNKTGEYFDEKTIVLYPGVYDLITKETWFRETIYATRLYERSECTIGKEVVVFDHITPLEEGRKWVGKKRTVVDFSCQPKYPEESRYVLKTELESWLNQMGYIDIKSNENDLAKDYISLTNVLGTEVTDQQIMVEVVDVVTSCTLDDGKVVKTRNICWIEEEDE